MTAIIIGIFLAMFLRPYYNVWLRVVKYRWVAAIGMMLSIAVPLSILCWYCGAQIFQEAMNLMDKGPAIVAKYQGWIHQAWPDVDLSRYYEAVREQALGVGQSVWGLIENAFTFFLSLLFMVYFVTRPDLSGEDIVAEMPFLKDETKAFVADQINQFLSIMVDFFQRQTVICLIEGCLYGLGFWLVGVPYGFLLGFALGCLNLCPFLGTIICMPVALPLAYFYGGGWTCLALSLVVWVAGQVLDGYVITPRIQGRSTGLGYAGVIFSFIFWGSVFHSMLGLLLAIPLSAFCVVLWRGLKSRYLKPVV